MSYNLNAAIKFLSRRFLKIRLFHSSLFDVAFFRVAFFLALFTFENSQQALADSEAETIVSHYDEIMGPQTFESEMEMISTREDGSTRQYIMKSLKSGDDKFRIWFLGPASVLGQEILRVGDNSWVYIPTLKRASRIANRDSFQGGDFNNADILKVNYRLDYSSQVLQKTPGKIKVELKAKTDGTAYDRIILVVGDKDFQPLEGQYFGTSGKILRSAVFSETTEFQKGHKRPKRISMKNEVSQGRNTILIFKTFKTNVMPPSQRFSLSDLGK